MNTHIPGGLFSFASFSPSAQRAGGWSIGAVKGGITTADADALRRLIPTSLNDGHEPGTYPSRAEIAKLTRRFAWLPLVDRHGQASQVWAFYASAHAGQDSTGRPGNVFSVVQVCPNGTQDIDPVEMLYSPDIPVPFGKNQVDKAQLPERISVPGPVTTTVVEAFIHGWEGECPLPEHFADVAPTNPATPRIQILSTLVGLVQSGSPVVLACPLQESALWVTAVGRSVGKTLSFSTYETPDRLLEMLDHFCQLIVVKTADVHAAQQQVGHRAIVVNVEEPLPVSPEAEPMNFVLPDPPVAPVNFPHETPPTASGFGDFDPTVLASHPHTIPTAPLSPEPAVAPEMFAVPQHTHIEEHSQPRPQKPSTQHIPDYVSQTPIESLGIPVDMAGENPFNQPPVGAEPDLPPQHSRQPDAGGGGVAASISDANYGGHRGELEPGTQLGSVLELSDEDIQLIGQRVDTLLRIFSVNTDKSQDYWRMLARLNQLAACPPHTVELAEFRARILLSVATMENVGYVTSLRELGILNVPQRAAVLDAFVPQAQKFLDTNPHEWDNFISKANTNLHTLYGQSPQLALLLRDGIERLHATKHSIFGQNAHTTNPEPSEAWRIKDRWNNAASQPQIIEGKR